MVLADMVRCPNCGQKTSGDYCQWCKLPILNGSPVRHSTAQKAIRITLGTIFIILSVAALVVAVGIFKMIFDTNIVTPIVLVVGLSCLCVGILLLWISNKFLMNE